MQPHLDLGQQAPQGRRGGPLRQGRGEVPAHAARRLGGGDGGNAGGPEEKIPARQRRQGEAGHAEGVLKVGGERGELGRRQTQDAAMIQSQARSARTQVQRGGDPRRAARESGRTRRRYLGGGDARWGGAGQIRAAEPVREPLAPTVLERCALPETARALDSRGGPRYAGAAERRPIGAVRQVQVGDHNDDLAHRRYRNRRMQFTLEPGTRANLIRGYSAAEIRIGQHRVQRSCIVTADRLITDWEPESFADLAPAHLEAILALTPEVVLLGTGATQRFAPPAVRAALAQRGVGLEAMPLGAACRTFNVLVQEERRVAAALFLR